MKPLDNYKRLIQYADGKHNKKVTPERLEVLSLYFGSILANSCNFKLYNMDTDRLENINFYGMLFLPSSAGKGYGRQVMSEPFKMFFDKMPGVIGQIAMEGSAIPDQYKLKSPVDYTVGIGSSDIGIYIASLFIDAAMVGSLNVEIDEFGDHVGKADNINLLKEAYDGFIIAKLIQGDSVSGVRKNIEGLPTNLLAYGTAVGIKQNQAKMTIFKELTQTGLYRRSLIYHEKPMKSIKKEIEHFDISDMVEAYEQMPIGTSLIKDKYAIKSPANVIDFTEGAKDRILQLQDELIQLKNDNLYDDLIPLDENAHKMIEKVAAIIAILDLDTEIKEEHVVHAVDIFKRTRNTVADLFEHVPEFERMYLLLSNSKEPLLKTDIMKKIGLNNKDFNDNIELVDEFAHRFNKKMTTIGSKLKRFSIEEFEMNKLDKMIVSVQVGKSNKPESSINFKPFEVPFFGEGSSMERLVNNEDVQSFCLAHFEPSPKADMGHRKLDNFIRGQNMIAFDIDEGMTVEEAKGIFEFYTYIIYTTRSHQIEKNGLVMDRFRIVLPTRTMFYVSAEEHKELYENIAKVMNVPTYDVATRNVSRLWFSNSAAEVYKNEGDLLDVRCCLPETETAENTMPNLETIDDDESNKRIAGMLRWFLMNTHSGDRNTNLFRYGAFVKDMIGSEYVESKLEYANSKLAEPIGQRELNTIIGSASR